ncbi:AtpZ/AtpI family protein [Allosphingosinicella sp.]|uniref:AtpZ/AtpI family protein n=1 Tax=Allosphingosinicella sp. TaxID=2823234 RepID=UPI002F0DA94F
MAESGPGQESKSPEDARLESLDRRLRQAQADEAERTGQERREPDRGQVQGMRVLSVLISYPLGSALIGYAIDRVAGTSGIWVGMLFLGFGAAMWQGYKVSQQSPR